MKNTINIGMLPMITIEDSTHVYPTDISMGITYGMQGIEDNIGGVKEDIGEIKDTTYKANSYLAKQLGYSSYDDLVKAAEAGDTIVKGGYVKTTLIDAKALVVNQLVTKKEDSEENFISIEPQTGAQFFVDGVLEASMNAVKFNDVSNLVPNSDLSIVLTEYGHTASASHIEIVEDLLTEGTYTNNTGIALNLTIPALTLQSRIYTDDSTPLESEVVQLIIDLTSSISYSINGSSVSLASSTLNDLNIEFTPHYNSFGQLDGYSANAKSVVSTVATNITIPAGGTLRITANHTAVNETYGLRTECAVTIGNRIWDGSIYTTTLDVGGVKILTQYGGNGAAFVKSTNQYIAMLANKSGTQFEMRSGNYGFKVDDTGVYYYSNGKWQSLI